MRDWLTRYSPRYWRSLAYMLQATEYNIRDYLDWYLRTTDFAHVEKRKSLVPTKKALAVWAMAAAIQLAFYVVIFELIVHAFGYQIFILATVLLVVAPIGTAYLVIVPLWLLRVLVQKPLEWRITSRAHKILMQNQAIKIGIAGSFGKTSMREILRAVLSQGRRVAAPPHSFNTPLGISQFIRGLSGTEEILIFELGEYYPGDVRRLCQLVNPSIGVITGVNEAHLNKFKSVARTVATIFELADYLPSGPMYVNGESSLALDAARSGRIEYSSRGAADWQVKDAKTGLDGTTFTLSRGNKKKKMHVHSQLLGLHQIGPLAAAAAIASRLGLTDDQIKKGLEEVAPFEHRLEPSTDSAGVITLDDSYNGNPDGTAAVIAFLGAITGHRRWYVTPGLVEMGSRTGEVHEQIGRELAGAGIEKVVLIKNSVTPYIARGLELAQFKGDLLWYDSAPKLFAALPHLTAKEDVVLLQNDWPDQYS